MLERQSRLDLAEYFSIGALLFGIITTAITKQLLYSLTPLAFTLFFNTVNLQKYKKQSRLSLEQNQKINNIYHDLITFSEDYKYQKLELEALVKKDVFPAGSMKPKVEAAIKFAKSKKGRISIITSLEKAPKAFVGSIVTKIQT